MYVWDMVTGKRKKEHPELKKSETISEIWDAMDMKNDDAAIELIEKWRWGNNPTCPHCQSPNVYKMTDAATGERNKRRLWRCRECKKQYTVRIGTAMEHSHVSLSKWVYAIWRACTSKKGVAALELKRNCQITYRAALFMLNRIRCGVANAEEEAEALEKLANLPNDTEEQKASKETKKSKKQRKLGGIVEADETYVGGKPRRKGESKRGRGTKKIPVFAAVERYGSVRAEVVTSITGARLKKALRELVAPTAIVLTDELSSYNGVGKEFDAHHTVHHGSKQYARPWPGVPPEIAMGDSLHTNTIESFFAILKRSVIGIYHSLSPRHLHRYLSEYVWRYNIRDLNDGDRTVLGIQLMVGKRLTYRQSLLPQRAC
jgi:transposase-like protein